VPRVDGALVDVDVVSSEDFRAVMRVLTTQMGFVMSTVALPAMAPAMMDSSVVRRADAREDFRAAREKKERVHSYPSKHTLALLSSQHPISTSTCDDVELTVIIHEIRNTNPKHGALHARIQPRHALALDDAARGIQCRRLRALGLDLRACGERDERIRQGHAQQTAARTGQRVRDIVALLGSRACRDRGC
jgi:hypothetical protein